jgi:hypothetical protein
MSKRFFFFGAVVRDQRISSVGPDGHTRITQLENGKVVGGTTEEHERMQEVGMRMDEKYRKIVEIHGEDADARYFDDAMREAIEE